MLKAVLAIHLILVLGLIAGCGDSDKEFPAAEPGDLKTLQRLADSYTQLSTQLEASPVKLRPEARKKFIIRVFNNIGLSYHKSLIKLGNSEISRISKNHRDLAQLLRLPYYGQADSIKNQLYDSEELSAISKMEKW